jgi:hypothetical protein
MRLRSAVVWRSAVVICRSFRKKVKKRLCKELCATARLLIKDLWIDDKPMASKGRLATLNEVSSWRDRL